MTYATIAASGRGKLVLWVRVSGFPWVFATEDLEPDTGDAWYWTAAPARRFTGVKPWLRYAGIQIDEHSDFIEGTLDVGPVDLEIVDIDGGFTELLGASQYRSFSRTTTSVTAAEVAAYPVEDVTAFDAQGVIWVDQEAIYYDHKDAGLNELHLLTRGYYGTIAAAHDVDLDIMPPVIPLVTDGPTVLGGRRAHVYAAEVVDGAVVGASECIYRGTVGLDSDAGDGIYRLRLDHITGFFSRQIGRRMPTVPVRPGYSYCGGSPSQITIDEVDWATSTQRQAIITLPAGAYDSISLPFAVNEEIRDGLIAAGFTRSVGLWQLMIDGVEMWRINLPGTANYGITVHVAEGDPLWSLGFSPGGYSATGAGDQYYDAPSPPRLFVAEIPGADATSDLEIITGPAGHMTTDCYATIGPSPYMRLSAASATAGVPDDYVLTFEQSSNDRARTDKAFIVIDKPEDLVCRHVFAFPGTTETIKTALQKMLGIYAGMAEPQAWCVTGLEAADFDFTELDSALVGCPLELRAYYDAIRDPITVGDAICSRLGLIGIAPRLTDDGCIGFARLETPHDTIADSVELDSAMWSLVSAAKVRTVIEGQPRISSVTVVHSHDYRADRWAQDCSVSMDSVNTLGKIRTVKYQAMGLVVAAVHGLSCYRSVSDLIHGICDFALGTHFGIMGRPAPVIAVACTWTSRQLLVGDVVRLTHPCLVDVAAGEVGVTDRLGIVVGRRLQVTDQGEDVLEVLLPPATRVDPISPCAVATAWNPGTVTLTVPATGYYCQAGETDLTYFSVGMFVQFIELASEAPATWGPSKIDNVGANSIVLSADPFAGAFPATGVWVVYAAYDSCAPLTGQHDWLFFGDTSYSLGAAGDECNVWAL